ncbi:rod shape-determining protein MreC [bacterium]|nr:rod shape-determining protein MreC [bacterium]
MLDPLKPYVPWLAAILLALGLIFSNDNTQVNAIRAGISDCIVVITHPFRTTLQAPRVWDENKYLRKRLAEMSLGLARLGKSGAECERLRRMLDFKQNAKYKLTAGDVIARNPESGLRSLVLNIGYMDSIKVNQAVITPEGLVGRVHRVNKESCVVQLLSDPNIGVAGRLTSNNEDGIVHSVGSSDLRFDGVPATVNVEQGDSLVTSGSGNVFPSNLFIGSVIEVKRASNGWLLDIRVQPAVNYRLLDELFVISDADRTR